MKLRIRRGVDGDRHIFWERGVWRDGVWVYISWWNEWKKGNKMAQQDAWPWVEKEVRKCG